MRALFKMKALLILSGAFLLMSACEKDKGQSRPSSSVTIITLDPDSPAAVQFGEYVHITIEYLITFRDGARIWVQPFTNGSVSPGYVYSPSDIYNGEGDRVVRISVKEGEADEVVVDQLRVVSVTPDQSDILFEAYIDVQYTFRKN